MKYVYELVSDENGTERRINYRKQDLALTAWQRAVRRNTCFAAILYRHDENGVVQTLADYQSEMRTASTQRDQTMSDDRYKGAMPDSFFRKLSKAEEKAARQWAHDNYSLTLPPDFGVYHPVVRDEWRKIENE